MTTILAAESVSRRHGDVQAVRDFSIEVAEGESVIDNAQVIERTFAGVLTKLKGLGAQIEVEP